MANMSYCRFENTYNDLVDCMDNCFKPASNERDERYRVRLLELIKQHYEDGDIDDVLSVDGDEEE